MKKFFSFVLLSLTVTVHSQIPNYVPVGGLQGYWPFTNNANDASGNGRHGTVNGAQPVLDRFGNPSSAYSFNGTSDFIATNYPGILGGGSRAVSFWARTTHSATSSYLVSWGGNSAGARFGCAFYDGSGTGTTPAVGGAFCNAVYASPASVCDGSWHHYMFQFGGQTFSDVDIYQDGLLLTTVIFSTSPGTPVNTGNDFNVLFGKIGYQPQPEHYNGLLDDIGIWDRTLSECEIERLVRASDQLINLSASSYTACPGQPVVLTASGGSNYVWNTTGAGGTITVTPNTNTLYSVTGITPAGCTYSASAQISVSECLSAGPDPELSGLRMFPNPADETLTIENIMPGSEIEIYSIQGSKLYSGKESTKRSVLSLSDLQPGMFLVSVRANGERVMSVLVKN